MKTKIIVLLISVLIGLSAVEAQDFGRVVMRFCEGTGTNMDVLGLKEIDLTTIPDQRNELCIQFFNQNTQSISLRVGFVDGAITKDTDQRKACRNEGEGRLFGNFVTGYEQRIVVPARGSTIIRPEIMFPQGLAGDILGCVTYQVDSDEEQTAMIAIQVRKAHFINASVSGQILLGLNLVPQQKDIWSDVIVDDTFAVRQSRTAAIWRGRFGMINTGNVALNTQWTGSFQQCLAGFVCWGDLFVFTGQQRVLGGDRVMHDIVLPIARRRPWYRLSLDLEAFPDLLQDYAGKPLVIAIPVTTISVVTTALIILLGGVLIALVGSIVFGLFYKRSRSRHEKKSVVKKRSYKSSSKKK